MTELIFHVEAVRYFRAEASRARDLSESHELESLARESSSEDEGIVQPEPAQPPARESLTEDEGIARPLPAQPLARESLREDDGNVQPLPDQAHTSSVAVPARTLQARPTRPRNADGTYLPL